MGNVYPIEMGALFPFSWERWKGYKRWGGRREKEEKKEEKIKKGKKKIKTEATTASCTPSSNNIQMMQLPSRGISWTLIVKQKVDECHHDEGQRAGEMEGRKDTKKKHVGLALDIDVVQSRMPCYITLVQEKNSWTSMVTGVSPEWGTNLTSFLEILISFSSDDRFNIREENTLHFFFFQKNIWLVPYSFQELVYALSA